MLAFLDEITGLELVFVICAAFGGSLFVLRLILMFMGAADSEAPDGMDVDGIDVDGMDAADGFDADAGDVSDTDISFKLLSLQGITAFFMMFGLVGWAVIRQGDYPPLVPIASGTVAGLATIWVMKKIFQWATSLQSSGTMNLNNAIGQEGTVYLTIRPGEIGKVQVNVQNRLSVLNAITEGTEEIKTGADVRITKIKADKLVVEKLNTQ
ncbi:MAG: NfeD family protein [Planctomycetota bacterium]